MTRAETPMSRPRDLAPLALRLAAPALAAALALGLAGCGSAEPRTTTTPTTATASVDAAPPSVSDAWTKAADSGMTGAFGTVRDVSDADIRLVAASSDAATTVELHEMAANDAGEMVMRPVEGGLVVPAGGELVLAPGGYHIMLMSIIDPIQPGEDVTITLTAADGTALTFVALARTFDGGNENYGGGMATATPTP